LSLDDARLAIARNYDFLDWPSLAAYVETVSQNGPVLEFESAAEALVNGDVAAPEAALRRDPALVRSRSSRLCCLDPPVHRATLLHYVAANGVEASLGECMSLPFPIRTKRWFASAGQPGFAHRSEPRSSFARA
jgi:hypothetical protein